jgi:EpsI family protein
MGWAPATILALGAAATVGVSFQQILPLRQPLSQVVPDSIAGYQGEDVKLGADVLRVAGVTDYLMRAYSPAGDSAQAAAAAIPGFSVYVGYYDAQSRGKTIHSPKNCLPGAGWESLTSGTAVLATAAGAVTVNRYLVQNGKVRAVVLYWYQGRGRVQANEYVVKWDLLRDKALRHRSDEALVRVMVPVTTSEDDAFHLAERVATGLVPDLYGALPS